MVVLSSRIIPGNEKTIFRMIDHLAGAAPTCFTAT